MSLDMHFAFFFGFVAYSALMFRIYIFLHVLHPDIAYM